MREQRTTWRAPERELGENDFYNNLKIWNARIS